MGIDGIRKLVNWNDEWVNAKPSDVLAKGNADEYPSFELEDGSVISVHISEVRDYIPPILKVGDIIRWAEDGEHAFSGITYDVVEVTDNDYLIRPTSNRYDPAMQMLVPIPYPIFEVEDPTLHPHWERAEFNWVVVEQEG